MKFLAPTSKYPKIVYVKSEAYRVVFTKRIKHYGECDPVKRVIYIKAGMSKRESFKTLLHELLHAIEFESDANVPHKYIEMFENGLFEIMIDNFV